MKVSRLSNDEATVGRWFTARFGYEPANAEVSLEAVELDGFVPFVRASNGSGRLLGRPRFAGDYEVTVVLEHGGVEKTFKFTVEASCADGQVELSDRSCMTLSINGIAETANAVVGNPLMIVFSYAPASATLSVPRARLAREGLRVEVDDLVGQFAGIVTLTLTASRADQWNLGVAVSHLGQTKRATIKIRATCPAGSAPHIDGTGNCTPTASVPAGCAVTSIDRTGRSWWGRVATEGPYSLYGSAAPAYCGSLSESHKAVYYSFTVPAFAGSGTPPDDQKARVKLTPRSRRVSRPPYQFPGTPLVQAGAPTLALWRLDQAGRSNRRSVRLVDRETAKAGSDPGLDAALPAGRYLIELAPTTTRISTTGSFDLQVWIPTPEKAHADVKHLGNTGLNGAGMTLEQFLNARGTLAKSSSVETSDPSDPASPTHPWLPFTGDWCSVPASWKINLFQIILNTLSGHNLDIAQYITQEPKFGGIKVPFYYACLRHDFNWRNLHRVKHYLQYDTGNVWNKPVRNKADERFRQDLVVLCNANQYGEPKVPANWNWILSTDSLEICIDTASEFKFGVSTVSFSTINYKH